MGPAPPPQLNAQLEALAAGDDVTTLSSPSGWTSFWEAIQSGPDPRSAARRALDLPPSAWHEPPAPALVQLLHEGSYPARMIALDPCVLAWLGHAPLELTRASLRERIDAHTAGANVDEAIARVRNEVYLELACREVQGRPLEDVGPPLGELVGACLDAAMDAAAPTLRDEVVVFAMGKLAGAELNYLSDVDFVFVHRDGPEGANPSAQHSRRMRLHNQLRQVLRSLEGPPRWRPVFRVDLRLRPFGSRGPLSMSLAATERYYETQGRDWERQVWLRATPMCGAFDVGETLQKRLIPFVYRRTLGPGIFEEVEAIMRRARRESRRQQLSARGVDLKLDRGGIREIEFFSQALQLMHAGRRPELRSPSTLKLLDRLAGAGLLSDHEHAVLVQGYRWLRRVEHRVQLAEGQQTHLVPMELEARTQLSRRLAHSQDLHVGTAAAFDERLESVRASVCEVTALFGENEAPQRSPQQRREWARDVVLDQGSPEGLKRDALEALGLRDAAEGAALLAHLESRVNGPWRQRGPAGEGARRLLMACLDSADPDAALRRLVEFSASRPAHYALWRHFADPQHAQLVQRAADLFGASEPLSRGLIGNPNARDARRDAGLALLLSSGDAELPTADQFDLALREGRPTEEDAANLVEESRRRLLILKHEQLARIGAHDLARRADPLVVGRALSDLADCLVAELARVTTLDSRGSTLAQGLTICAFAMGKYGMQAMDYGSDLDLFFVFDGAEAKSEVDRATRVARRFLAHMQGSSARDRLYEVDMRLRPSGGQGLLVSTVDGLSAYHAAGLPVWERLALLRARPICWLRGTDSPAPQPLVERVKNTLRASCFAAGDGQSRAHIFARVRRLRDRISSEIARETRAHKDVKSGRGGVLEFELMVGALQLVHGASAPSESPERGRDVLDALSAIAPDLGLDLSDTQALCSSYRFMRRLLNRLRMQSGGGSARNPERFDINSPRLSALARRMGVASGEELIREHTRHAQRIRDAFELLLPA